MQVQDNDEAKFNVILHKANCTAYNFACRAKQDEYNVWFHMPDCWSLLTYLLLQGNTRTRYGISSISPLNYKEEAMALRDLLHSPWAR